MREGGALPQRSAIGSGWVFTEWLLGIFGGFALFMGLFIMLGGEDEYVGLAGGLSWRVGDIGTAWMYGLIIGGALLLVAAFAMVMGARGRIRRPSTPMTELLLHVAVFVLVNAFVWAQDYAGGGGLDYAYWTTAPWGVGLLAHAVSVIFGRRATVPEHLPEEERELVHH